MKTISSAYSRKQLKCEGGETFWLFVMKAEPFLKSVDLQMPIEIKMSISPSKYFSHKQQELEFTCYQLDNIYNDFRFQRNKSDFNSFFVPFEIRKIETTATNFLNQMRRTVAIIEPSEKELIKTIVDIMSYSKILSESHAETFDNDYSIQAEKFEKILKRFDREYSGKYPELFI